MHLQFEFHLISQICYSIDPENFQRKLALEKVEKLISVKFQVSELL